MRAFFRQSEMRMCYFGPGMPTSTTVEVRRLSHPDFMVDVAAEAVLQGAPAADAALS